MGLYFFGHDHPEIMAAQFNLWVHPGVQVSITMMTKPLDTA
jgi:hypothetical protein